MKEKIYTIPVLEAFRQECECPLCILEKSLEERYVHDILNHSTMDVHTRTETNQYGFCRMHYELMYARQFNRLELGLLLDTHIHAQNAVLDSLYKKFASSETGGKQEGLLDFVAGGRKASARRNELVQKLAAALKSQEEKCTVCRRVEHFMYRYVDIILLLWSKEEEFRSLFAGKKGFCKKHFRQLLERVEKGLPPSKRQDFITGLLQMQLENLHKMEEEVHWFTQKFAYHNKDAPWGNSRDALIRGIQKVVGYCALR